VVYVDTSNRCMGVLIMAAFTLLENAKMSELEGIGA